MMNGQRYTLAIPMEKAESQPLPASGELRVVIMRAGEAKGLFFSERVLAEAAPLFEGVPSYVDHAGPGDSGRPGGRSVRDLAGRLQQVHYDEASRRLLGTLSLYRPGAWVASLASEAAGLRQLGLSPVLWLETREGKVWRIHSVESVDIVMNPAAGGAFLPPEESAAAHSGPPLKEEIQKMSESSESGEIVRVQGAAEAKSGEKPEGRDEDLRQQVEHLEMELALGRSGLPEEAIDAIRARFAGRGDGGLCLTAAEVQETIAVYKDAYSRAAAQGSVRNLGHISDVLAPVDRLSLAMERLMGLQPEGCHSDIPRLSGIREAYDLLTGDWERRGVFRGDRVQMANASSTTMVQVVAGVLNKVLLRQFESRPRWWAPVAYEEDFSTLNDVRWITVGGFSDLDTVGEGDPYTEKTWADAAEISPFQKHGNYIGLTLEMIDRDDVAAVRAIPRRLAYAAYRTLSGTIAGLFTTNEGTGPTLADGHTLFHASHGNLGSSALQAASWQETTAAMFKQPEFNSGKRLGVRPRYCLVPIDLEKTALEIFTSEVVPTEGAFFRNVLQRSADSVIVVPDWSDPNDWAASADPAELEGICIGYRFGRAPELFVADDPTTGSMFTNDEMRIKCRFVFAVGIGDYRALYKHNVTG